MERAFQRYAACFSMAESSSNKSSEDKVTHWFLLENFYHPFKEKWQENDAHFRRLYGKFLYLRSSKLAWVQKNPHFDY